MAPSGDTTMREARGGMQRLPVEAWVGPLQGRLWLRKYAMRP